MREIYPFTAIVGQKRMRRALILNAIDPRIGGVLIRGERGTAKSTAARAMAALLPEIEVFAESPFNDNPHSPETWSDWAKERMSNGTTLDVEVRTVPFIDLPVSATEDRVVGTLDIEVALKTGSKKFEPGVLASANRGLLYIDEVNLLDDHVVDVLLDSAAMGVNMVEREGISFSVSRWWKYSASSRARGAGAATRTNPDEGSRIQSEGRGRAQGQGHQCLVQVGTEGGGQCPRCL